MPIHSLLPCLSVLPAGKATVDPSAIPELLGKDREFRACLERFQVVLVDTPPLSVCDDPLAWSSVCDEVIFVIAEGRYRGLEPLRVARFQEVGVKTAGTILTQSASTSSTRLGRLLKAIGLAR